MNTRLLLLAALGIAALSGTGGWFLGRSSVPVQRQDSASIPEPKRPTRSSTSTAQSSTRFTSRDLSDFKSRLSAEADPLARFKLATSRMEDWVNSAPEDALAWIKSQEISSRRNELIRRALAQFAENDPKAAAQWSLENLKGNDLNNQLIRIAENWATQDPQGATAWFSALPSSSERDAALETLLFRWSSEDPPAATRWLGSSMSDPQLSSVLRYAAYAGWAKSDPRAAVSSSLQSSISLGDPGQFANTIANWAVLDLPSSSSWLLENVKPGDQRKASISELSAIFAAQSPQAGLQWIDKLGAAEKPDALNRFTATWAESDAPSAARWLASENPQGIQPDSVSAVVHGFLASDEKGFRTWFDKLPPGPLKTAADQVFAEGSED